MATAINREELLAKALALDEKRDHYHRVNGYQLSKDDIQSLDDLIQRALAVGCPDALRQFVAIRTAYELHGKVSYVQLKLLKEVSDAFQAYHL
jgi:hypothetical protein